MESDLEFLHAKHKKHGRERLILNFNMKSLEREYDYDTDED
jgi:hypothetical protein